MFSARCVFIIGEKAPSLSLPLSSLIRRSGRLPGAAVSHAEDVDFSFLIIRRRGDGESEGKGRKRERMGRMSERAVVVNGKKNWRPSRFLPLSR